MSGALEGEHYCEAHQGNHSHYDAKNCTVCQLEAALLQERENAHAESCRIRALTGRVNAAEAEVEELGNAWGRLTRALVDERERRKSAEAKLAAIEAGYREAIEDIEDWAAYADEYFQEKHDLAGCLAAHRAILRDEAEGKDSREGRLEKWRLSGKEICAGALGSEDT